MCGFLLRILVNSIALIIVINKLPGLFIDTFGGTLLGVAIIGIANAAIRPLWSHITDLPYNSYNLGIVTLMVNLVVAYAVIHILPGYQIVSMTLVLTAAMLFTVCSVTLSKVIQDR